MRLTLPGLFYGLTVVATWVVSAILFTRAQRNARSAVVSGEVLRADPKLSEACLLEIYRQKYLNFRHFDTLRWGVHTVVITAGGLVVTLVEKAAESEGDNPIALLLMLFGVFAGLGWWLLYRLAYHHMKNSFVLEKVAREIGDLTIPPVPQEVRSLLASAAFMFMAFVGTLGALAIVVVSLRWFGID